VVATAGPEQEYFLIDRNFFFARPDLPSAAARCSAPSPPKGQEFEDQYFGAIPERVLACMLESERELFKLGVPVKTRHNEVAPSQYEIAPVYETPTSRPTTSSHHDVLQRVARSTAWPACCTRSPSGINGSGKHLNWSLGGERRQPAGARRQPA
jgi:glutamine synthetase